jgi:proteic killer suppression protein
MRIRDFAHKGLKPLYTEATAKGVPPDTVDKLRKMFAYLDNMEDPEELRALTAWKVHMLTGDRKGTWSLSVTRNRRLTFRIDTVEREVCEVSLEDYH